MQELTSIQIIGVLIAFTALLPAILVFRRYRQSEIPDYLLLTIAFLVAFFVLLADALAGITDLLIFYKIHHISIDLFYLLMFTHGVRVYYKSNEIPKWLWAIAGVWFSVLFIFTLLWTPFQQPETAKWLFFDVPHSFSSYFPDGAGLKIGDTIIYSSAFRILGDFYRIFTIAVTLIAYLTVDLIYPTERILTAKKLWITTWIMLLFHALVLFPWVPDGVTEILNIFLLIGGVLMIYISLKYPEGLLLSHAQISRIMDLYDRIQITEDENKVEELQIESLLIYLRSVKSSMAESAQSI